MAHKGRPYPVHPRRDFNENSDISLPNPYPRDWHLRVVDKIVPPYPLNGTVWDCHPISMPANDSIFWQSATQRIDGQDWFARFLLQWPSVPSTIQFGTVELHTVRNGLACYWYYRTASHGEAFKVVTSEANTINVDHTYFFRGCNFHSSIATPIGY